MENPYIHQATLAELEWLIQGKTLNSQQFCGEANIYFVLKEEFINYLKYMKTSIIDIQLK